MSFHSLCGGGPALLLGILLAVACWFVPLLAQDNPCDPHLAQLTDDPYGYRLRGDRCEGIYIREDAGNTTLLVASFTEHFEDFAPTSSKNLKIQWAPLEDAVVRLRAQGLSHMLHYRMDSIRPPGNTTYIWPSSLLAVLQIRKQDIGVVGRTSHLVGDTRREVYVPLWVAQQTSTVRSQNYQLVLLPGQELSEIFLSLVQVGSNGSDAAFLRKDEPLRRSYYPAERPIAISLPELKAPGLYRLEVGAILSRGGSSTETIWLYLPRW